MAEIHPNDIGLATFADVGDVERLRTTAKNVVEAINEIYETGGSGSSVDNDQIYVDGENNIIIGKDNIVYGSNNLIIGSENVVVGNDLNVIGGKKRVYKNPYGSFLMIDFETNGRINFFKGDESNPDPFQIGDICVISASAQWSDVEGEDTVSISTGFRICEITDIGDEYFKIANFDEIFAAPDSIHTVLQNSSISFFAAFNGYFFFEGNKNAVILGEEASGYKSSSVNVGHASGYESFAANDGTAAGRISAAFGYGISNGAYSLAANYAEVEGESSAAFNKSSNYSPYSGSFGNQTRVFGRPLKCTALDGSAKRLTIESGQNVTGISGKEIVIRMYNRLNPVIFKRAKVSSISNNILTLTDVVFADGYYGDYLYPQSYAFVIDNSTNYSLADFVSGYYSIASGKYSFAHGSNVLSAADGAVTFGKYGNNAEEFSLALANGSSLNAPGFAFFAHSNGDVAADGEYTSPCADYAEFFEWADGNPETEDRAGYFVKLQGDKIVKCGDFDTPLGVVSATPAIVGDSSELHWRGKFVTDDFGRIQYHDVVVSAVLDDDGNTIIEEHIERQPVLNPKWDASAEYIPRKDRSEWSTVGVLGKLVVYDDGTLKEGDVCRCGEGGIAVKSIENGYHVLKRIADDKVLIWFRGE